ncbi:MAG: Metallopeptidase family protein [Nitrospira sp.]|nr:MAG: Metallopeptidase family protein [Nitrospira sp.]
MAGSHYRMSVESFSEVVQQAMAALPAEYARLLDTVAVVVEDEPPASVRRDLAMEEGEELLGLYQGLPLSEESFFRAEGQAPAQISLYRGPILRQCDSEAEMVQEIADTLVHELGHHVGLSDDEMPY